MGDVIMSDVLWCGQLMGLTLTDNTKGQTHCQKRIHTHTGS